VDAAGNEAVGAEGEEGLEVGPGVDVVAVHYVERRGCADVLQSVLVG
jgi:hypothetical protein